MKLPYKISGTLVVVIFVIISIFAFLRIDIYKKQAYEEFYNQTEYISLISVDANKLNLWDYFYEPIENYINTIMREKSVHAVVFYLNEKIFVSGIRNKDKVDIKFNYALSNLAIDTNNSVYYIIDKDVNYRNTRIAGMKIAFTTEYINEDIKNEIISYAVQFFILVLAILILVYFSLNSIILRPLFVLSDFSIKIEHILIKLSDRLTKNSLQELNLKSIMDEYEKIKNSKYMRKNDEIGNFFYTYALMIETIYKELKVIIDYSISLEEKVEERTLELEKTHAQMLEQAHKAGMAELAASTIHNIGNAVNSLNLKISNLKSDYEVYDMLIKSFRKIRELIDSNLENIGDFLREDPKGKQIMTVFEKSVNQFDLLAEKHKNEFINELQNISQHIIQIIHVQNSYSTGVKSFDELVEVDKVIDDACEILMDSFKKRKIELYRNYLSKKEIMIEKNKFMQVIVNVIKNAIESIDERFEDDESIPEEEKYVSISTKNFGKYIIVKIKDNGLGFGKEVRKQMFNFKFSTKKRGSGFGLHYSSNFFRSVNGSIFGYSKGEKMGASMIMILPENKKEALDGQDE